MNRKKVFTLLLAVVVTIAAIGTPASKTADAYYMQTEINNGSTTWSSSSYGSQSSNLNSLGENSVADPAYSKTVDPLSQEDNEYNAVHTKYWHTTTYSSCEYLANPADPSELYYDVGTENENSSGQWRFSVATSSKTHPNDEGTKALKATHAAKSADTNTRFMLTMGIKGDTLVDLSEYTYLRMSIWTENAVIDNMSDTGGKGHCFPFVMLSDGTYYNFSATNNYNECIWYGANATAIFCTGQRYELLVDLTKFHSAKAGQTTVQQIGFFVYRLKSADGDNDMALWIDNIRLIKNTTHTQVYSYNTKTVLESYHNCEQGKGTTDGTKIIPAFDTVLMGVVDYTSNANSVREGLNSARMTPASTSWGKDTRYGVVFNNSTQPINPHSKGYEFFTMDLHIGGYMLNAGGTDHKIDIYFLPYTCDEMGHVESHADFSNAVKKTLTVENYHLADGWHGIKVACDHVDFDVKAIYIDLGTLTIPQPEHTTENDAYWHFDKLEFHGYSYTSQSEYTYLPGHYKILEDFESLPSSTNNVEAAKVNGLAMRYEDIKMNTYYANNEYTFLANAEGASVTKSINGNSVQIYAGNSPDIVTQGQYAYWFRPNTGNQLASVVYDLKENGQPIDISKFSHYSLDLTIRNPQRRGNDVTAADGSPGLTGNKEQFRITLTDANSKSVNLVFQLNLDDDPIVTSKDWGVEAFPLEGFVPGYTDMVNEGSTQQHDMQYSATGSMRLTFHLGELVGHPSTNSEDFDFTKVTSFTFVYRHDAATTGNTDSRGAEFFLDNLVGYTPDMTLTVQNNGTKQLISTANATANANSTYAGGNANYAIDGDPKTKWYAQEADESGTLWLEVDYKKNYHVTGWKLILASDSTTVPADPISYNATKFTIQYRVDGSDTWQDLVRDYDNSTRAGTIVESANFTARYVRLLIPKASADVTGTYARVQEFRLFEDYTGYTDNEQRFYYTVAGRDTVTDHVDLQFALGVGQSQTMVQMPLNGYAITQTDWSWRYDNNQSYSLTAPTLNDTTRIPSTLVGTNHTHYTGHSYKQLIQNPQLRNVTVTFFAVKTNTQWLQGQDHQRFS